MLGGKNTPTSGCGIHANLFSINSYLIGFLRARLQLLPRGIDAANRKLIGSLTSGMFFLTPHALRTGAVLSKVDVRDVGFEISMRWTEEFQSTTLVSIWMNEAKQEVVGLAAEFCPHSPGSVF